MTPTPETAPSVPAPNAWTLPSDLPRKRYEIRDGKHLYDVILQVEAAGNVPAVVELVFPAGLDFPCTIWESPAIHLIVTGAGPNSVLRSSIDLRDFASVEIRDVRFDNRISRPLTLHATQHISVHNVAFLDQRGIYQTTNHGVIQFDYLARLETDDGGTIDLSDITILGARGVWPAIRMLAPGGRVAIARTLVADTDRPPFFVGIADTITIEDSVLALPAGTKDLLVTNWPPDGVTIRRSTVLADTPDVLVPPGNNPRTSPSLWMPTVLVDSTLYTRGPDPGAGPGVTLERSTIEAAPNVDPDLTALRARAEALAPVERTALLPLLGLEKP